MLDKEELKKFQEPDLEARVERHLTSVKSEMAAYATLCQTLDEAYVPTTRDHKGAWDFWPEGRVLGQAHVNIPVIYMTVNLKSNILGMRAPRFNIRPVNRKDPKSRSDAELVESIIEKIFKDENMAEVHLNVCRNLSLYGRAVIQDGPEFTLNIDQQANVWVSWRRLGEPESISFIEMVSMQEALDMGWDGLTTNDKLKIEFPIYGALPHDDPLGARHKNWPFGSQENLKTEGVPVLHFYYQKRKGGTVYYAKIINGMPVSETSLKRKTFPFIIIEAEHIPGMSTGVGDAEPIIDIQQEINERNTAWAEAVRRTIKDQWKAWGLHQLNSRMLPGGGQLWEMTDKESEDIEPIKFVPNDPGMALYLQNVWSNYRRVTGIPSEAEGESASATSGFAMNVKFQALVTNLAPRRIRLQRAYKQWALNKLDMVKRTFPAYAYLIDEAEFTLEVGWEEITPRDMKDTASRLQALVASKLTSPYTAMEELTLVPEDEIALMEEFWTNPKLNPQGAMAEAQAMLMLQQVAMASQQQPGAGFSQGNLAQQAQQQALTGMEKGGPEQNQADLPMGSDRGAMFQSPVVQNAA